MAKATLTSAGVSTQEIDLTGQIEALPVGVPAGVIGTANKGPAFVPVTVASTVDFFAKFGDSDGKKFGPLAAAEWLRNARSLTYVRVLGVGRGERRLQTGNTAGSVQDAGFVVGEQLPNTAGAFVANSNANSNGPPGPLGRLYFLGCYMSQSVGSRFFSDAATQEEPTVTNATGSVPIVRGVVMAASGVVPRLSSSYVKSGAPPSTGSAVVDSGRGAITGSVVLLEGGVAKQEFVMLLNGHVGANPAFPNVVTASFDMTAQNYFADVMNKDPLKVQDHGYLLYAHYDIPPVLAAVTGTGLLHIEYGQSGSRAKTTGHEPIAFLTTGTLGRNVGNADAPNYENFEDRFRAARSPKIISQKFGGSSVNLFHFEALDDGETTAQKIKVSVENIVASDDLKNPHGTFDVVIRDMNDTDDDKIVLEEFRGLSLNPSSDRYIAKAIGDLDVSFDFDKAIIAQKLVSAGNFANKSRWVRVVMDSRVDDATVDKSALPMGFRGFAHLVTSGTAPVTTPTETVNTGAQVSVTNVLKRVTQPPVPFRTTVAVGAAPRQQANANLYWGVQFEVPTALADQNAGRLHNKSIDGFAKYFPDYMTSVRNVVVMDNEGAQDTAATAILDADRFNNNSFTLENVRVVTGSDGNADPSAAASWEYVRRGGVSSNAANKTRAMSIDDLKRAGPRTYAKYSLFLQGGFNGTSVFDKDEADMTNNAVTEEMNNTGRGSNNGPTVRAYRKALEVVANKADVDVQLLAIPGIRHAVVTDAAIRSTEERFDALYLMDIESRDNLNTVVTSSAQIDHVGNTVTALKNRALDSSFAAAYWPDVFMLDPTTKTTVRVPPSCAVLGAFALNDSVGFPWFAPAGFTRGAMPSVTEAAVRLTRTNMDDLYAADINPLVAFANSNGVIVWGQKTLQQAQTALDRVNVRRLLIEIRRQVRQVANAILFEPNRESTLARFSAAVNPRLSSIQAKSGLDKFKVVIDSSTTTDADVANNIIRGRIFVTPTRTAETISLDFVVTNQGSQAP